MVIKALNSTGLIITLLNLLLMALDHYIAIIKPLKYPVIIRKKKVISVILIAWLVAFILGFSDFFSAVTEYSTWSPYGYNYCEVVWYGTMYQEEYVIFAIAPISLGIMVYSYSCIYWKIHKRRAPGVQDSHRRENQRNTKALVTTLLALGSFIISWLPQCLFQVSMVIKAYTNPDSLRGNEQMLQTVDRYLYNLLVFNAIFDPIIYTVRLKEVKLGFQRMFCGKACGFKSNVTNSYIDQISNRRIREGHTISYANITSKIHKDADSAKSDMLATMQTSL